MKERMKTNDQIKGPYFRQNKPYRNYIDPDPKELNNQKESR